jgi:hypothetical protein
VRLKLVLNVQPNFFIEATMDEIQTRRADGGRHESQQQQPAQKLTAMANEAAWLSVLFASGFHFPCP